MIQCPLGFLPGNLYYDYKYENIYYAEIAMTWGSAPSSLNLCLNSLAPPSAYTLSSVVSLCTVQNPRGTCTGLKTFLWLPQVTGATEALRVQKTVWRLS